MSDRIQNSVGPLVYNEEMDNRWLELLAKLHGSLPRSPFFGPALPPIGLSPTELAEFSALREIRWLELRIIARRHLSRPLQWSDLRELAVQLIAARDRFRHARTAGQLS